MPIINFISFQCEENQIEEARYQYPISTSETRPLCDESVNLRHNGITAKSHNEKRRADFRKLAQIMYGERPDRCVNQCIREAQCTQEEQRQVYVVPEEHHRHIHQHGQKRKHQTQGRADDKRRSLGYHLRNQEYTYDIAYHRTGQCIRREDLGLQHIHAHRACVVYDCVYRHHLTAHVEEYGQCAQYQIRI